MISLGQKAFAGMKDLLQKLNLEQEHEKAFENIYKKYQLHHTYHGITDANTQHKNQHG